MDKDTIEWKEFEVAVDLHKSYLDFAVKLNFFYYAITGAILSFHFSKESPSVSLVGLLLPISFSIALGIFFLYGVRLAYNLRIGIKQSATQIGMSTYPEGIVLMMICAIFGTIMICVGIALIVYLING